ncbi:MAG: NAD(P)H-dependent glycerol-3-phosphate dehydrogenase [Oligoflexus sp.]
MNKKIPSKFNLVLGAGNFGTCLAQHLASKGEKVVIWGRSEEVIRSINEEHRNCRYLSDVALSPNVTATCDLSHDLIHQADSIILAIPTQYLRGILSKLKPYPVKLPLLVCSVKGIEDKTYMLPIQIIGDVLGEAVANQTVILSGPSFAIEVIRQLPTSVSVGSWSKPAAIGAQELFHTNYFRAYTSDDPIGLEVAGALKNVIAIAAGACHGLGLQQNAQAALLTRGLAEMTRVGVALGANPLTFIGLGGVGDLFLTCTSTKSRNFSLGYHLGQGASVEEALARLGSVAEGFYTAKASYKLSQKLGTDTPIIDQVYAVLYGGKRLEQAVQDLMSRAMKPEVTLPETAPANNQDS